MIFSIIRVLHICKLDISFITNTLLYVCYDDTLKNIKDFVGKPFENSNIVNETAKCIVNLNKAYINYVTVNATCTIVELAVDVCYFVAENIVSNEIAKWFE